jgi:acyl-CoA thioester hydrolase
LGLCTESKIVVRYAETDRMGVVYYANYLIWMEVGRTDYLAEVGFSYSSMERDGVLFPACNASIRLFRPSYYEDRLAVLTTIECLQSRKVVFSYRVMRDNELVVSGKTEHICVDSRMRARKIPAKLFKALKASMDGTGKVER